MHFRIYICSVTANLRWGDVFKTLMQVGFIRICILDSWKSSNNTLYNFAKMMLLFSNHIVRNWSTLLKTYHNPRVILVFLASIYQTNECKHNIYFEIHSEIFSVMTETKIQLKIRLGYLLTPWCRVLLEKLTGLQLVKKFPAIHGTRRFINTLTSARHLPLSRASSIQSIYPHPTSWRSILIFSTHLCLGLRSGLLPSGFPTKTLYTPSPHP